jgi:hypothetical protein
MADDAAPQGADGQAAAGQETPPATEPASESTKGPGKTASRGNGTSGTPAEADSTSPVDNEPTFFDPKSVPTELQPAYKQMQGAFTKAMQRISADKNKVEFYNQFAADPVGNMQKLAAQYGYRMTREQAAEALATKGSGDQKLPADWQPQSWEEVFSKAEERAAQKIFGQLQPLLNEVKQQKRQTIERQLSEIDPGWQQYEQEMADLIQQVPGLAAHPEKLYRLSVPPEVIESRATQRAIKRLEDKAKATAGAGGSTTTKKPGGLDPNQRFTSVQEAAAWAQRHLEDQGKWPPKK